MNTEQKPILVNVIAVMTLLSGVVNLFWGFITFSSWFWAIVCMPVVIGSVALGICEIVYAAKILSVPSQPVRPSQPLAIFQIAAIFYGNIFSAIVGILSLIFFNDQTVKEYFAKINNVEVIPPAPAPAPEPVPAPVIESAPVEPSPEVIDPAPAEEPAKPKRIRKIA